MENNLKKVCRLILIGCSLFTIPICCSKYKNEKVINEDVIKSEIKEKISPPVIYFDNAETSTMKAVSCEEFIETLKYSIYYITIQDDTLIELLEEEIKKKNEFMQKKNIDVRYRIELDNHTLCIDKFGDYYLDGDFKGKLKKFDLLLKYIYSNKEKSTPLEKLPS